jgi:peptidoglycan/LPS O-acetylase OafA/YrhL
MSVEHDAPDRRRADLQGLRALAVFAVLAYHFGVPGVSAGFVGVDVFFVLSGFFITRLLLREIEEKGRARLALFWANRAKRLLPNGLLCIAATLLASVLILPSYRLPGLSQDALSAAAFFANFHFAAQAVDYFHLDVPQSPLLHFWSLAVEEQFYAVLPLLILLVTWLARHRNPRHVVLGLLLTIAAASFAGAMVMIGLDQPKAFFHPQFRAWQLALGGCVGLVFAQRAYFAPGLRAGGALLGFVAVCAAIFLLDDNMSYPGGWALLPTLGTAALVFGIDAKPDSWLRRAFALRSVTYIGDMSYSLYLWHWPVAVFLAALWPAGGYAGMALGLVLSLALAWLAYRFVELPLHRRNLTPVGVRRALIGAVGGVVLTAAAAVGLNAIPGRSDPAITARIAEATADLGDNYNNGCHLGFDDTEQPECRFAVQDGPRMVLWGDSHAAQWFTPLVVAGESAGWAFEAWTKTSCPTAQVTIWYPPSRAVYGACETWRQERLAALLENPPDVVLLGNYSRYYGWIYDPGRQGPASRSVSEALWQQGFRETTAMLLAAGIHVVELRDTPQMYVTYKDCLSAGDWSSCHRPRADALAGMASPATDHAFYRLLDLSDVLCDAEKCRAGDADAIWYRDSEHLTASHAATLHGYFERLLADFVTDDN